MSLPFAPLGSRAGGALLGLLLLAATPAKPVKPVKKPAAPAKAHRPSSKLHRHTPLRLAHGKPIPLQHAPGSRAEAYAAMSRDACLAELGQRHIPFSREEPKRGVKIPVRLTGKVGGVLYRTDYPDSERASVPWEVFDCRLVLSLDDFSTVLREHSVAEVRIFSAWRPPAKSWPMDEWGRRHQGALAIDLRELRKDTGEVLNVLKDFHGQLGSTQCAPAAPPPTVDCPEARELHALVCEASEARIFNSILTPNYNPEHRNHFHLELTPDVDWFMLR
ncbi:MAG: hypothetical protein ABUL62_08665 [Myxococcales bacterium]